MNRLSLAPSAPPSEQSAHTSGVFLGNIVRADELSVSFQPIVSLDTGKVFACEALVRCDVPIYSHPEKLFAEAVNAGCTGRLGRMIREVATSLCRDMPIFMNVHPVELREPWLIRPDDPIYTHSSDVYLEITESVPFEHFDVCHSVLREIRWRGGVHLVVDDLGAGYSNLKRISDLEPKVVKLDRELVRGIHENVRQQWLVKSVVQLCQDMDARVVAEGIETAEELSALRDAGVHYGQGYLFARPAYPIPEITWPASVPMERPGPRSKAPLASKANGSEGSPIEATGSSALDELARRGEQDGLEVNVMVRPAQRGIEVTIELATRDGRRFSCSSTSAPSSREPASVVLQRAGAAALEALRKAPGRPGKTQN
jgi:EAL domain-containing protein (putative c-di-GMP-specific phosphodiesterase class I)